MNIANPAPNAPLSIFRDQTLCLTPQVKVANMPIEELGMWESTRDPLTYPLVVGKNPYFLKSNNVIR